MDDLREERLITIKTSISLNLIVSYSLMKQIYGRQLSMIDYVVLNAVFNIISVVL